METAAPMTGGTPLEPWMTLALTHRHPRDNEIHFYEPTHVYTVQGVSKGYTSVSTILHSFFAPFDADAVITNMMKSRKWPESKWFGMTREEIKAAWDANRDEASEAGTAMHLAIEKFMNGVDIVGNESVEWKYFQSYWAKDSKTWEPWRTEWEVWDADLKLAGSIDMVYRNRHDGTFAIYDWKRSKEIKTENSFQSGLGPLAHLPDTNFWHYSLQLNLYRWLLETHYGIRISKMALVVLHPNNTGPKVYPLNRMDDEIEDMLAARRRAVAEGGRSPVVF
jgi:hypothetical protein